MTNDEIMREVRRRLARYANMPGRTSFQSGKMMAYKEILEMLEKELAALVLHMKKIFI